jgi:poly(3-hydroxybutyrate) depolymerase
VILGLVVAAQALACGYYGIFAALAVLAGVAVAGLVERSRHPDRFSYLPAPVPV